MIFNMDTTIDYYNKHAKEFAKDTYGVDLRCIQDNFLSLIQSKGKILDVGCGAGRDALYFKTKGYTVTAFDGSFALCQIAQHNLHQDVMCKRFEDISYCNEFNGVWACSSLLHVPFIHLPSVIEKIIMALREGGVFYCSFKYGDGEYEQRGRHFTSMNESLLNSLFGQFSQLQLLQSFITFDERPNRKSEKWMNAFF